jgi:quercetin dioxygenase-like cupin family protein
MKNEDKEKNINHSDMERFDAPITAPEHHKIVFENEQVRIMAFRVAPGDVVPVHTHRWSSINYVVRLSDFQSFDADGHLKLDTRTVQFGGREGEAFCLPPFPPLHSVKNIGTCEMLGISVELKDVNRP